MPESPAPEQVPSSLLLQQAELTVHDLSSQAIILKARVALRDQQIAELQGMLLEKQRQIDDLLAPPAPPAAAGS